MVLATLLLRADQVVSRDELVEIVWDGRPPSQPEITLRTHVLRLRRALGPRDGPRIRACPPGYRIDLDGAELDVREFDRLVRQARADAARSDWAASAQDLTAALALVRGRPLADVPARSLQLEEAPAWPMRASRPASG